jgi:hypothetical protein
MNLQLANRVCDDSGKETKDQNRLSDCLPPGTLVRMADGSEQPIQDIKVLEKVVTAEGNIRPVTQVMTRWHRGELLTPQICGYRIFQGTSNHPILTKRGYVELRDLRAGDLVAFPKHAHQGAMWIATQNYISERFLVHEKRTVGKAACHYAGRQAGVWEKLPVPDLIHLTPDVGRLLGLFLAEGHTSAGTVFWSFGKHEHETLVVETVGLLKSCFDLTASVKIRTNNVAQVTLHGTRWARLFEGLFLSGAANKRMPRELMLGPVDFLQAVLHGWLDGDRQRGTSACTISHDLAMNMFDIANVAGYTPRIETRPEHVDKRGTLHKKAWVVHWTEDFDSDRHRVINHRYRTENAETCMWRKVDGPLATKAEVFEGYVFNIEVEGDHSYIAEGVGVHDSRERERDRSNSGRLRRT